MKIADVLAEQLEWTRDWTLKLLADFRAPEDWSYQPAPGLAHATWLAGHLAVSQDVLVHVRCLGRPVLDDQFASHFQIGGPVPSLGEHPFPAPAAILATLADMQRQTLAAIRQMSDALLAEPCAGKDGAPHPHYRDKRGAVSHCIRHEAFHAGQLATIRRLRGKAFLR